MHVCVDWQAIDVGPLVRSSVQFVWEQTRLGLSQMSRPWHSNLREIEYTNVNKPPLWTTALQLQSQTLLCAIPDIELLFLLHKNNGIQKEAGAFLPSMYVLYNYTRWV